MGDNIIISSTQQQVGTSAANLSLVKLGTMGQTILGVVITSVVIAATVATVILVGTGVGYQPPVANPDHVTMYKTETMQIFPLRNDKDPKGAKLQITKVTQPSFGAVQINEDRASVAYRPNAMFAGTDTFQYTISNDKLSSSSYVNITVLNRAPECVDFEFKVSRNSENNAYALFDIQQDGKGIVDVDNDELFMFDVSELSSDSGGIVSIDNKTLYYTPAHDFSDEEFVTYKVTDRFDICNGTVTFKLINDAPVAVPDTYRLRKNLVHVLDLLANDYDVNGDKINITYVGFSRAITQLTNNATALIYRSLPSTEPYYDSVEYQIKDFELESSSFATIELYNTPPVVHDQTVTIVKNSENNLISITFDDEDEMDTVAIRFDLKDVKGGVNVVEGSGMKQVLYAGEIFFDIKYNEYDLYFTPDKGQDADVVIPLTADDGYDQSTGQIHIVIQNTAPVAVDDTADCSKNNAVEIDVIANDSDPNGDDVVVDLDGTITTAQGGTVTKVSDKKLKYKAPAGFVGTDTFVYTARDVTQTPSKSLTDTAKVTINVFNEAPVAKDDKATVVKKKTVVVNVLENDSDPNNDELTIASVGAVSPAAAGTATITADKKKIQFTATGVIGVVSFPYTIKDDGDLTSTATVSVTVTNTVPVSANFAETTYWNRSLTIDAVAKCSDADGDALTILSLTQPANGAVSLSNNKIVFVPLNGFVGTTSFTYVVTDGQDSSPAGTVTVNVKNDAPRVTADTATVHWRSAQGVDIDVLANDVDEDPLVVSSVGTPSSGTVSIVTLGNGRSGVRFIPSANTITPVTFKYRASDWNQETEGTVTVTLTNKKPVPANDEYTFHWRQNTLPFNVLTNDKDDDSDPFTIASVTALTPATVGQLTSRNDATGDIVFKLTATQQSQLVPVTFQYSIKDIEESTTKATVKITPTNKNTPQTDNMSKSVHWRSLLGSNFVEFAPYSSTTDADGDPLTLTISQQPQVGSATLNQPSGVPSTVRFSAPVPSNGWKGTASFKYRLSDGPSSSESTMTVTSTNQAPSVAPIIIDLDRRYIKPGLTIDVIAQTTDGDSADVPFLTLVEVTKDGNVNGTCSVLNNKLYYKTEAGLVGTDKFKFTVTDGLDTTTGTLQITNTYEGVAADSQFYTFHWRDIQSGVPLPLIQNIQSEDDLTLTVVQTQPTHGTVDISSDKKSVTYTPYPLYVGVDSFVMSYSDGTLTSIIEVTVEITNSGPTVPELRFEKHWALLKTAAYGGLDVLSTASDPEGDDVELVSAQLVDTQDGNLSFDTATGKVTFTLKAPNADGLYSAKSTGGVKFKFVISDKIRTFTQTATLIITNTAPTPQPLSDSVHWDLSSGKLFSVLQGATDANSDAIRLLKADSLSPSNSGLSLQLQGNQVRVQGKAPASLLGKQVTFIYYVTDDYSTSSQVVTLTVTNQKPVAKNPSQRVHWRQTNIALSVAEASGDSDTITVASVTSNLGSISGRVTWTGATITYNPPSNLVEEKLTFTITDGIETASGVATLSVYNTAPVAKSYTDSSHWRTVKSFTFSALADAHDDDSLDAPQLTVSNVFEGARAGDSVSVASGVITVTPGETSRRSGALSIRYSVTDGKTPTYATIDLTFTNTAPTASNVQKTVDRVYGTTRYTVKLMDTSQDSDGDPLTISYLNGAQYVSSSSSDIYVTVDNTNFVGNKLVQFAYSDSIVQSNIATATITFRNTKPSCPNAEIILKKGETKSVTVQCTDANGDPVTVSLTSSPPSGLTQSGNTFTFTAPSGKAVKHTVPFTGKDSVGESSAPATLTIRVQSQLPVVNDYVWPLLARRDGDGKAYLDYKTASGAFDPDGDPLTFTVEVAEKPTPVCTNNKGQVVDEVKFAFDANNLRLSRPFTFSTGTCTLYVRSADLDGDYTIAKVTVNVYTQALTGVGSSITVDHKEGTFFTMSEAQIMVNEKDPLGGTLKFIEFYQESTDCNNPDAGFCNTPPTNPSSQNYRFSQTSDECQTRRYRYRFQSNQDTNQVATAIFDVRFQKCKCVKPLDIVFVFDGSGSVGSTNFKNMAKFAKDIITPLDIGTGAAQTMVGVVVFNAGISRTQVLTGHRQTLNNLFDTMSLPGGNTNIRSGVLKAEELLLAGRGKDVPKMIITIFDGEPNEPCSCSQCRSAPNIGSDAKCISERYPSRTCLDCSSGNPLKCNPCGDVLSETMRINKKKPGHTDGYWRVMSIGVGPFSSNKSARDLIADISYDANLALAVDWNQLDTVVSTIQSQSCDLVDTSKERDIFTESGDIKLYCGQIIGLGQSTNYLYATSSNLFLSSEDFNQEGNRANLFQIANCGSYGDVLSTASTFSLWSLETKKYVVETSGQLLANSVDPTTVKFKFTYGALNTWTNIKLVNTNNKYPVASTTKVTLNNSGTVLFVRGLAYSKIKYRGDLSTIMAVPSGSENMDGA